MALAMVWDACQKMSGSNTLFITSRQPIFSAFTSGTAQVCPAAPPFKLAV